MNRTDQSMTCDEVEALLPLVADGAIDQAHDPVLFAHLATCERCQESLASHDLVGIALAQRSAVSRTPRILRPTWQRWVPAAAAALVAIGMAGVVATRPGAATSAVAAATAKPSRPIAAPTANPITAAPPQIEIEVVAVPGSSPDHPHYLVRKGQQVLLVAPASTATEQQAPPDAKQASYERRRRY